MGGGGGGLAGRVEDTLERPHEERREEGQQAEEREDRQPDQAVRATEQPRREVARPATGALPAPGPELGACETRDAHTRTRGSR